MQTGVLVVSVAAILAAIMALVFALFVVMTQGSGGGGSGWTFGGTVTVGIAKTPEAPARAPGGNHHSK